MNAASSRPQAYRGPYPIRSHRTLADLGFGDPATLHPAVIGLDLGRSPDIHVVQVIDAEHRVIGQRFRSVAADQPREDPRDLQQQWDRDFVSEEWSLADQFRAINAAMQPQKPDEPPTVVALAYGLGCAIGGAALIGAVVFYIAFVLRLIGGQ